MAKLKQDPWTGRQASTLIEDEDEAFLRPEAAARQKPARSGSRRAGSQDLVPNYEEAEAFLRTRRRVAPRKGSRLRLLLRSRLGRGLLAFCAVLLVVGMGLAAWAVHSFLVHDPHFRIDSSASIEATGITELSRTELVNVFGSDIGRNIFFVPLAAREAALEAQPWVRHATVMRLLPHTLRVTIEERVPVAFVRIGRQIGLVDAEGVLLSMPPATLAARHYSFPVVVGLDPNGAPAARAERMHLFAAFAGALDAGEPKVTPQLSEVDLTDMDDVRAVVPAQGTDILLHFGNSDYLERWHAYQEHLPEWRQQYPNLSAVDLRYDRQVVLKMADAAKADEAAEARALPVDENKQPAPRKPGRASGARGLLHAAAQPSTQASVRTGGHAAGHGSQGTRPVAAHSRTWYTMSRPGPYRPSHWVPHTLTTSGRSQ